MYEKSINLLDLHLSEKPEGIRKHGILYVTDLTKPCLLCAYLDIVEPKMIPVEKRRVFECGRLIEEFWIKMLDIIPDTRVLFTQLPAYYQDARAHGNRSLVVHEVKSIKSLHYVKEPLSRACISAPVLSECTRSREGSPRLHR